MGPDVEYQKTETSLMAQRPPLIAELETRINELFKLVGDGEEFFLKFGNGIAMYGSDGKFVAGGYMRVAQAIRLLRSNAPVTGRPLDAARESDELGEHDGR